MRFAWPQTWHLIGVGLASKRMARTEPAEEGLQAPDRSPLSELIAREEFERVLSALESLPRSDRDLIVTRYLHGQDYGTMARERGRKPDQVRALCHKALRRLRRVVEKRSSPQRDEGGTPK
jgi:RNA polymerase sigma factor (sigma-70 family)